MDSNGEDFPANLQGILDQTRRTQSTACGGAAFRVGRLWSRHWVSTFVVSFCGKILISWISFWTLRTKDKILYNKHAGHMLRTKLASADEGGVIAGVGALDSPYLVDCCD